MIKRIIITLIFVVSISQIVYPRADIPKPGTVKSFFSPDKTYSIEIKILGYPDRSPSECTFKEKDKIIWVKELATTPGFVEISNDGKYFIFANWGWYDEGGYKSISFYRGDGNLLKTIEFGSNKAEMRWLSKTGISGDGNYYVAANDFKDNSQVTLYHVPTQTIVWDKNIGLEKIDNILMNRTGDYILVSTFDYQEHNISFYYLSRDGNLLWEKKISRGHLWNQDFIWLSEDGLEFKVFDKDSDKWQCYENQSGKVVPK